MSDSTNATSGEPDRVNRGPATQPESSSEEALPADGPGQPDEAGEDVIDAAEEEYSEEDALDEDTLDEDALDGDAELEADAEPVAAGAKATIRAQRSGTPSGTKPRTSVTKQGKPAARPKGRREEKRGLFARIAIFVRQVIAEVKKVVRPTRSELLTYIAVVLVFVLAVMAYVGVLDFAFGKLVLWTFGS